MYVITYCILYAAWSTVGVTRVPSVMVLQWHSDCQFSSWSVCRLDNYARCIWTARSTRLSLNATVRTDIRSSRRRMSLISRSWCPPARRRSLLADVADLLPGAARLSLVLTTRRRAASVGQSCVALCITQCPNVSSVFSRRLDPVTATPSQRFSRWFDIPRSGY